MTRPTEAAAARRKDGRTMQFLFDPRELDDNLRTPAQRAKFEDDVEALLTRKGTNISRAEPLFGAIVGMLVLDGATDVKSATFEDAFWSVRGESEGRTLKAAGLEKRRNGEEPDDPEDYADNAD